MPRPLFVDLSGLLAWLGKQQPLTRARVAGMLVAHDTSQAVAAVRRAAIYESTRAQTYAEVARALGVSEAAINKAVTEYRRPTP